MRMHISSDHAATAAERAAERLLSLERVRTATAVALYAAVRGELDTRPVATALLARDVTLAYPRVVPGQRELVFHEVTDPATLVPCSFGIPEPAEDAPAIAPGDLDVIVIPGLAFDTSGGRLGWGRGYYDATLAPAPGPLHVGYAYDAQLVEIVPTSRGDVPMDCVITESGVHVCGHPRT